MRAFVSIVLMPSWQQYRLEGMFGMDSSALMRHPLANAPKSTSRRQLLLLGLASFVVAPAAFARGGGRPGSFSAIDSDNDGTIDLDEAKRAAEQLFQHLDRNHTGK